MHRSFAMSLIVCTYCATMIGHSRPHSLCSSWVRFLHPGFFQTGKTRHAGFPGGRGWWGRQTRQCFEYRFEQCYQSIKTQFPFLSFATNISVTFVFLLYINSDPFTTHPLAASTSISGAVGPSLATSGAIYTNVGPSVDGKGANVSWDLNKMKICYWQGSHYFSKSVSRTFSRIIQIYRALNQPKIAWHSYAWARIVLQEVVIFPKMLQRNWFAI